MTSLSDLWQQARQYGRVMLATSPTGQYWCHIDFNTIKHVELTAKSGQHTDTPEAAIQAAINNAAEIVESIHTLATHHTPPPKRN